MVEDNQAARMSRRASVPNPFLKIPVMGTLEVGDQREPRKDVDALGKRVEAMRDEVEGLRRQVASLISRAQSDTALISALSERISKLESHKEGWRP